MVNFDELYTNEISAEAITVSGREGWSYISISASGGDGTIEGNSPGTMGGKANSTMTIPDGSSVTIGSGRQSIDGVVITAPVGCTLRLTGVRARPNN